SAEGRLRRVAVVADRAVAVGEPFERDDRYRQRADGARESAGGAGSRRPVRYRWSNRLSEPCGVYAARHRDVQHARAVHDPEPEQPSGRLRPDTDVQNLRGAIGPVPVGSLQRVQPCELWQCPAWDDDHAVGDRTQKRELRSDPNGRRSAHHAVRAEVHVLMKTTFAAAALCSTLVAALIAADVNDWPSHDHD